jgi:hypothetical protein
MLKYDVADSKITTMEYSIHLQVSRDRLKEEYSSTRTMIGGYWCHVETRDTVIRLISAILYINWTSRVVIKFHAITCIEFEILNESWIYAKPMRSRLVTSEAYMIRRNLVSSSYSSREENTRL